jgi:hypothetical protein
MATLTQEQTTAVQEAKGSTWKKVLWWCVGILGLLGVIFVIVCLLKRKGPLTSAADVVKETQLKIQEVNIQAKVEAAKAAGVEQKVVEKIAAITKIQDEQERNRQLALILADDY